MAIQPNFPMVNLSWLYVYDLKLSYNSTTKVDILSGQCRDSTNTNDIRVDSGTTLTINSAVQGANGLDIGTFAADSFYAVYVIASSTSSDQPVIQVNTLNSNLGTATPQSNTSNNYPVAGLLSLSSTAPNLPEGYDMFRRVGYVLTDGSAHILPFAMDGIDNQKIMWYSAGIQVLNAGSQSSFTEVNLYTSVKALPNPSGVAILDTVLTPTGAGDKFAIRPTGSSSTNGYTIVSGDVASVAHESQVWVSVGVDGTVATQAAIDYKVTGTLTINVSGYIDYL